jgi:hypothetical protein
MRLQRMTVQQKLLVLPQSQKPHGKQLLQKPHGKQLLQKPHGKLLQRQQSSRGSSRRYFQSFQALVHLRYLWARQQSHLLFKNV